MKVLIIEDERPAADLLAGFLRRYNQSVKILNVIDSVTGAVKWFKQSESMPDLIFMDIQLTDGLSFEIFKEIEIKKPIIFITAHDNYALEAFKQNSIDYLLKPIDYEQFIRSLKKLESLRENFAETSQFEQLKSVFANINPAKNYKNRFLVKIGEHLRSVPTENINLFYSEGRDVTLITSQQKKYMVDYKMEELENMLDPSLFFRVGRSFIVNIHSIADTLVYSNSRLKISLTIPFEHEIIVSREKVKAFKEWFGGDEK
ncbi:MAG: LytTR family DNA-binding domain-containing protein [Bacteroidales bacterium]